MSIKPASKIEKSCLSSQRPRSQKFIQTLALALAFCPGADFLQNRNGAMPFFKSRWNRSHAVLHVGFFQEALRALQEQVVLGIVFVEVAVLAVDPACACVPYEPFVVFLGEEEKNQLQRAVSRLHVGHTPFGPGNLSRPGNSGMSSMLLSGTLPRRCLFGRGLVALASGITIWLGASILMGGAAFGTSCLTFLGLGTSGCFLFNLAASLSSLFFL